jgi:hypothetical protein
MFFLFLVVCNEDKIGNKSLSAISSQFCGESEMCGPHVFKPLLGTIETATRENATREKEEKSAFSLAWNTKEYEETDKNQLGPTLFFISPNLRRNLTHALLFHF